MEAPKRIENFKIGSFVLLKITESNKDAFEFLIKHNRLELKTSRVYKITDVNPDAGTVMVKPYSANWWGVTWFELITKDEAHLADMLYK